MNLTQRQLRMFVATATLGNVSRASEELHISQPALTRALQEFAEQLEFPLFRREGRGLTLTREGARFLPIAQRLLREMDHVIEDVRDEARGTRGAVTIAVGAAFGSTVLPGLLLRFAQTHPLVRVRLIEDDSGPIIEQVSKGEADLGIASLVGDTAPLCCEKILRAPLGLLADPQRFTVAPDQTEKAMATLPILKEALGTGTLHALRSSGSAIVSHMETGIELSSLTLQIALAKAGVGVAVVSALGASHPAAAGLQFTLLKPRVHREIYLVHQRLIALPPAVKAFQAMFWSHLLAMQDTLKLHPDVAFVKRADSESAG
jgi:LysR family carnitine catabolism transcriptional activator